MARAKGASVIFRCVLCDTGFALEELFAGHYIVDTLICEQCYLDLQSAPYDVSCFGKPTIIIMPSGRRMLGYDASAAECVARCPDRDVCPEFLERIGYGT